MQTPDPSEKCINYKKRDNCFERVPWRYGLRSGKKLQHMPIYMDRHDVSEFVTAEQVAELHQQDLKIQHQFGCRGITYWYDDERKHAFCLIEAPNREKLHEMHAKAHGEVPNRIIEVDAALVESFLGRIEDPEKEEDAKLNIIKDPAFRIVMIFDLEMNSLKKYEKSVFRSLNRSYGKLVADMIQKFNGRIVIRKHNRFVTSFTSVDNALKCALKTESEFRQSSEKSKVEYSELKIGICAGVPVTQKESIFEDTLKLAESMYYINAEITLSKEISELYPDDKLNQFIEEDKIFVLSPADQLFLIRLMEFTDSKWQNTNLKVESFQRHLGFSKSQLYRKMMSLTGDSPNSFILRYRLKKILGILHEKDANISEAAYACGFSSPSYFAKCFRKRYGMAPSVYKSMI